MDDQTRDNAPRSEDSSRQVSMSNKNALKMGCMITLGVFTACFIVFCAIPAGGILALGTVGAAMSETGKNIEEQDTTASQIEDTPVVSNGNAVVPNGNAVVPNGNAVVPNGNAVVPNGNEVKTSPAMTVDQARAFYQQTMTDGLIANYDRANETIYVNDSIWNEKYDAYKDRFSQALITLISNGTTNYKPFRVIGTPSKAVIIDFKP